VTTLGTLVHSLGPQGLLSLSDQLVVVSTHHHSLLLDRTVTDALGGEGWSVRYQASFEATHTLLSSLCEELGISGTKEKLELADELFVAMGQGKLDLDIQAEGAEVLGRDLHHGACFVERYSKRVRNKKAVDAFAAGYAAAAASLALPSDWAEFEAEESSCVARGDDVCRFSLRRQPERARTGAAVRRSDAELIVPNPTEYPSSDAAKKATETVARLLASHESNERGIIDSFGTRLAVVPINYIDQITFDTMHLVEKRTPELFQVFAALVREAAQCGVFHLLGSVLQSSEWLENIGLPSRDAATRLEQMLGAARALGLGAVSASDFIPGRKLVLRTPVTHETVYYSARYGNTVRARLQFLQGTALAIMQLLHRVDFGAERPITTDTYDALFGSGTRFYSEETQTTLRGDAFCEVVVEALADR